MQKIRYLIIALLCAVAQGAWAQTNVGTADELRSAIEGEATNITLTDNMTVDKHLTISRAITIDLGGFTLRGNSTALDGSDGSFSCIFIVSSAGNLTLSHGTLADANNSATSNADHSAGAIVNKGTATLTGVTILNCKGYNGGAINNHAGATLTINSVTFTDNTASYCGGAIYNKGTVAFNSGSVSGSTAPYGGAIYNTGTYTMADGTISNCNSTTGGGGGIVNIGTVNISGGTFTNNTANTDGGAIWNGNSGSAHGTLTMTGGSFTGNTANRYGGGIWTESTVNMSGNPSITNNTVSSSANNVYLNGTNLITCSGAFTDGANIGISLENYNRSFTSGYKTQNSSTAPGTYFHADNSGATLSLDGNEVSLDTQYTSVSNEDELRGAISNGANIKLTANINISSAITIGDDENFKPTVTINLGGHTLNRGATSRSSAVIGVKGGSTLYLSNGTVTGGWGGGGGGIWNEGTMHLTNVIIDGNTADDRGGGISNNGALTMTGCTVSSNTCRDGVDPAGGGGIFNYYGKTATLTNCTIEKNTTEKFGGGGICNYGTMYLNSCTLTENTATTKGGGIWNGNRESYTGTLYINGCTITDNSAGGYGDGIYIDNSTLNMQGLCTVTGNTDSNVYLYGSSTVITVSGAFTSGSNIGVGFSDYGRKFTSGYSDYNSGTDPGNFFSSDNYKYGIGEKDGEAYAGVSYVERSWTGGNTTGHVVEETKICTSYTTYSSNTNDNSLSGGWYLLSGTFTFNKRVTIDGDVKFILQDGCNVEFDKGIYIPDGKTLTIYGQTNDTGYLWTDGSDGANGSIGGNEDKCGGSLVIHGGKIYAKPGSNNAAGIGGGNGSGSGMRSVTIWGGTVTAEGKSSGAGIGCGQENSNQPTVNIRGGSVTATGGSYAAGIGGGEECTNGTIHIWGGTITATGGHDAPGIGSGEEEDMTAYIYIYGGNITATGGENGAGIGSGEHGSLNRVIYIDCGTITAKGGKNAAGIGAGKNGDMTAHSVSITGGTIYATGGENGAGIGGGYNFIGHYDDDFMAVRKSRVTVSGGNVYATGGKKGAGIGTGYNDDDDRQNRCLKLEVSGGYVEAKSRGADAACIGGGTNVGGCYVEITGGTVKCIYTNEYSNEYDDKYPCQYIGRGGSDDDLYIRTVSFPGGYKVTKDGSTVLKSKRTSTCQSHPSGYSTIIIEACEHEGHTYSYKNSSEHTFICNYCDNFDEAHEGETCSKCGYGSGLYTVTLYEANADGNGYNSTPVATYTVGYGVSFTFPECTTVPDTYCFKGWMQSDNTPASVNTSESEISSLVGAGESIDITGNVNYYARYLTPWKGNSSGTQSDPYLITSADDWDDLSNIVNGGFYDYSGKYFKLTADIGTSDNPVTTMIGSSSNNAFRGNFDGGGHTLTVNYSISEDFCAPFRYTYGATIHDLVVAGSVKTTKKYAGGVVGRNGTGSLTLYNVVCSATVFKDESGRYEDSYIGGMVGYAINANIERCAFTGTIKCKGFYCQGFGGFLGQKTDTDGSSVTIKDCLFAPTSITLEGLTTKLSDVYTFASGSTDKVTITNCYYTQAFSDSYPNETSGECQGTRAYTIESGTEGLYLNYGNDSQTIAEMDAHVNDVTGYSDGVLYNKKFYTGGKTNVTFTPLTNEYGKGAADMTASAGTLTNNGNGTYTLAMNNGNSSVSATIETYGDLPLYDEPASDSNTSVLETNSGQTKNITLSGRKLYKDGDWNTLCLPFDVSEDYMKNSDHPLHGATIMELDTDGWYDGSGNRYDEEAEGRHHTSFADDGTLYLYFKTATEIDARHPYIVKWTTTDDAITSPVFNNSPIEASTPKTIKSADGKVCFIGNFDPVTLTGGDKSNLYMGSGNQLYYPSETRTMNSFRAYFHVDLSNDNGGQANVRAFVLNFGGNDETTGIIDVRRNMEDVRSDGWYDLQGRKLATKPSQKGVYIYNGKKRVNK